MKAVLEAEFRLFPRQCIFAIDSKSPGNPSLSLISESVTKSVLLEKTYLTFMSHSIQ